MLLPRGVEELCGVVQMRPPQLPVCLVVSGLVRALGILVWETFLGKTVLCNTSTKKVPRGVLSPGGSSRMCVLVLTGMGAWALGWPGSWCGLHA